MDIANAPTQVSQVLIGPGELDHICTPNWTPDGSRIAFWGREIGNNEPNLFVLDMGSGTRTNLGLSSNHGCEDVAWSADGTRWIVSKDGGIRIVDADEGSSSYGKVIPRNKSKLAWG